MEKLRCYRPCDAQRHSLALEPRLLRSRRWCCASAYRKSRPTVRPDHRDEIANAAFFAGLMLTVPHEYGDISQRMEFDEAKANFFTAARSGLNAQFKWLDNRTYPASTLILDHLLPLARQGLKSASIDSSDIDKYLGLIEERVRSGQTGAQWMLKSLSATEGPGLKDERYRTLTSAMLQRQREGKPVHTWSIIEATENADWCQSYQTVGQFMATDLFTIRPDDLVDLAASVMDWRPSAMFLWKRGRETRRSNHHRACCVC